MSTGILQSAVPNTRLAMASRRRRLVLKVMRTPLGLQRNASSYLTQPAGRKWTAARHLRLRVARCSADSLPSVVPILVRNALLHLLPLSLLKWNAFLVS